MQKPLLWFSLFLLCSGSTLPGSAKSPASDKSNFAAIDIVQTTALAGDFEAFVTKDKLKVNCRRHKLVIYAEAPSWQVYTVNPGFKTVWVSSLDKFSLTDQIAGNLSLYGMPSAAKLPVQATGESEAVQGLKCRVYSTSKSFTDEQMAMYKKELITAAFPRSGRLLSFETPLVPAQASAILAKIYAIPTRTGLPVKLSYLRCEPRTNRQKAVFLDTISVKEVRLGESDFARPKDYRIVANFQGLDQNSSAQDSFEIMNAFSDAQAKPLKSKNK